MHMHWNRAFSSKVETANSWMSQPFFAVAALANSIQNRFCCVLLTTKRQSSKAIADSFQYTIVLQYSFSDFSATLCAPDSYSMLVRAKSAMQMSRVSVCRYASSSDFNHGFCEGEATLLETIRHYTLRWKAEELRGISVTVVHQKGTWTPWPGIISRSQFNWQSQQHTVVTWRWSCVQTLSKGTRSSRNCYRTSMTHRSWKRMSLGGSLG